MKENIPGCPGYHVTRNGKVYSNKFGVGLHVIYRVLRSDYFGE